MAGDNADASKFNHRCAHAVTSRVHARRVACPAHSEPPCRTRVPRSQPACPPRWRRARGQVAELLANVNLSDLHARRHRVHPHAVARPQGVHEPGVRPLAARRASCACVRWVAAPSRVHVSVPACLTGWYARGQQRIALLAAVPFLSVTYMYLLRLQTICYPCNVYKPLTLVTSLVMPCYKPCKPLQELTLVMALVTSLVIL